MGPYFRRSENVCGRGGTQLIDFKNKALVYLYLRPSIGILHAAWWARPSSPRPDLRRLRRAPGRGRFVYVFLYPGALPNAFVSSCVCWHLWVSLWHFAGPCGVSLALRLALGIHCGTLGVHFDTHGVQLGVFWALWGDLGASFRHPGAPFGYPWGPWWCLVGTFGCGPGPLVPLLWKMLKKGTQNRRQN